MVAGRGKRGAAWEGRGTWTSVTRSTMAKSAIGAVLRDHTWPSDIVVSAERNDVRATHASWGVQTVQYCTVGKRFLLYITVINTKVLA